MDMLIAKLARSRYGLMVAVRRAGIQLARDAVEPATRDDLQQRLEVISS